jgi:hypothetical protein
MGFVGKLGKINWWFIGGIVVFLWWLLPGQVIDHDDVPTESRTVTIESLDQSLDLGTKFLLANQKVAGNFTYEYDFKTQKFSEGDNQVRQAGALWGMALIYQNSPTAEVRDAIVRGLEFFDLNSEETLTMKYPTYPGEKDGKTGTLALVNLALIDFLRADASGDAAISDEQRERFEDDLDKYLEALLELRRGSRQFDGKYDLKTGEGEGSPNPYVDGESLLAMVKAYKYAGYKDLEDWIVESAMAMHHVNVVKALEEDEDSDQTKGFYQWGSMAFYEIYHSDLGDDDWRDEVAEWTIDLAYWMIDVHKVLLRTKNTAYAFEGIASAWELARETGDWGAMEKFGRVIDLGMRKLTSWQVGHDSWAYAEKILEGAIDGAGLISIYEDPFALGGVMNSKNDPVLRIDVTQHQMHAVILLRRYLYADEI